MKKQLAVLATLALVGSIAAAQDKGTEFKFGGEMEQRYQNQQNASFSNAAQSSDFISRNQFHVNAISSDKLQAYFDFIHTAIWGAGNGVPSNNYPYAGAQGSLSANYYAASPYFGQNAGLTNTLQVSEAWLWWKVSDMVSIRSGRQSMEYGDGLVFSKNDWLPTPYNVDGIMARMSWDFLDLDFGGGVLANLGNNNLATNGGATTTTPSGTDTETVFYGFYAQFKSLPDVLKKADIFAVMVNEDGGLAPSTFMPGYTLGGGSMALTSAGIHLKGDWSLLDYRLDGVYQWGKQKAGVGLAQDVSFSANMEDIEVGANFPEFMKGRVYVNWHSDSGNGSSSAGTNNAYQPLFYDRHTYAGMMDTFGFGNLTDIRFGLSVSPLEETTFGIEANLLSRTSSAAGAGATWLTPQDGNLFGAQPAVNASNSNLGTEVGITASHNYGHGFSMYAQLSTLSVGNYYTGATGANISNPLQFIAQAKYGF